jgi:valine--pyruvate aminotransferase
MKPPFSNFGDKFSRRNAVVMMMDDIYSARMQGNALMLAGGNPPRIDHALSFLRDTLAETSHWSLDQLAYSFGNYDSPIGSAECRKNLASFLNQYYSSGLTADHIAIINSSQLALFMLVNMFCGKRHSMPPLNAVLPVGPDYIGYRDLFSDDFDYRFVAPIISYNGPVFEYSIDQAALLMCLEDSPGCMIISNPNNPTGNILSAEDLHFLQSAASNCNIPLILDGAYADPFPGLLYNKDRRQPITFTNNTIITLSLSKLGLPGLRTGIVIASPETIDALRSAAAVISLSPTALGQHVLSRLIADNSVARIVSDGVLPTYEIKKDLVEHKMRSISDKYPIKYHTCHGAMFFWVLLEESRISAVEFCERMRLRNVLLLPGEHFCFGRGSEAFIHRSTTVRITFTGDSETLSNAMNYFENELSLLYDC